jgi:hypothetical protein
MLPRSARLLLLSCSQLVLPKEATNEAYADARAVSSCQNP